MKEKPIVISLGGSVLFNEDLTIDKEFLKKFKKVVLDVSRKRKIFLVIGGGPLARIAMKNVKNNFYKDVVGIKITEINARVVKEIMGEKFYIEKGIFGDEKEDKIPIYFGILPGISTDGVAALLAEKNEGIFVNVSNVDYIYTKDPKKHKNAKPLLKISFEEAKKLQTSTIPGRNSIIDLFALQICERSKIKMFFIGKNNIGEIKNIESSKKCTKIF